MHITNVYLSIQDSADEGATNHDKPTSFDTDMPKEFQAISHTFSAKMLHDAYPLLHEYDQPHSREYLPLLMFMRRYHGYRFAWCLENDVRYTGADWGILFNSMLNLATASLNSTTNLPQKYSEQLSRVPPSYAKLPDLIGMGFAAPGAESKLTEENMPRDTQHWRFKNYHKLHPAQVYAVSRLYIDTIHQHSLSGSGAFFEDFLLTLAIEEKLNVVMMPYPEFGGPFLDCCIYDGLQYYTDWYLTDACRHAALIHPVKGLDESVWGKGKTRF